MLRILDYMKRVPNIVLIFLGVGLTLYLVNTLPDFAYLTAEPPKVKNRSVYRLALSTDPPDFDPALLTDAVSVQCAVQLFDGLVRYQGNRENSIGPSLAATWTISENQKKYTFRLRSDAKFHSKRYDTELGSWVPTANGGRIVQSDDVKFSFERVLDPKTLSPRTPIFEVIRGAKDFAEGKAKGVEGIRVLSPSTFEIELIEAYAPFLTTLTMPQGFIVPREDVVQLKERFPRHPVGTGSFIMESYTPGKRVTMVANPDYFEGRPKLDRIEFLIVTDEDARFTMFLNGEIHHTTVTDPYYPVVTEPESKWSGLFTEISELGVYYYGFNVKIPPFDNVLVRRAFCHAVDREAIKKYLKNGSVDVATSPLPHVLRRWSPPLGDDIAVEFNPVRADKLLTQAGYPRDAKTGMRTGLPAIPLYIPEVKEHIRIAQAIQANLADLGVDTSIKIIAWKAYLEELKRGNFGFFRMGWVADYKDADNFLYYNFHSYNIGRGNYTGYSNPKVDELIIKARQNTNIEYRTKLYQEIEKQILKDAVWICLFYYKTAILKQPNVRGINLTEMGEDMIRFQEISLEN